MKTELAWLDIKSGREEEGKRKSVRDEIIHRTCIDQGANLQMWFDSKVCNLVKKVPIHEVSVFKIIDHVT